MGVLNNFVLIFLLIIFNIILINSFKLSNNTCNTYEDCSSPHTYCLENKCKCGPNYAWNSSSDNCEFSFCQQNCSDIDPNRVCNRNTKLCECKSGYTGNITTNLCESSISNGTNNNSMLWTTCTSNFDCKMNYDYYNSVCINNYCYCKPNYKYNTTLQKCSKVDCIYDSDCQSYDYHRICNCDNQCVCDQNYVEEQSDDLCVLSPTTTPNPVEKYCTSISNCGLNQFCINNKCECLPNYKYNKINFMCEYSGYCYDNSDCNTYDVNRVCKNSLCNSCLYPYVVDLKTKVCNLTVETICYKPSDCGNYEFCANNVCECQPNYQYQYNACTLKTCRYSSDCNQFDKNSICSGSTCICNTGYSVDPNTKFCNITVEKPCNNYTDCGSHQICSNKVCECYPGYVFDQSSRSCYYKRCYYDSDCNTYDTKRKCNTLTGYCDSCNSYYAIDYKTKICNNTIGLNCTYNTDCTQYGDYSEYCVQNTCQCKPGYKFSSYYGYCSYQTCTYDYECNTYDINMECKFGSCGCSSGYFIDYNTYSCKRNSVYLGFLWVLLVIPVICILIAFITVKNRKSVTAVQVSNPSINSSVPIVQSQQYLAHSAHRVEINDPPPPYKP